MEKKVMIFGARGTLGQELVREFLKNGYQIDAFDLDEIDVTSKYLSEKIIQSKPDVIINASGYNKVDLAETDETERNLAYAINAEAPKVMAESAKLLGAIFVNYSTDFVFDGESSGGYTEDDNPNPVSEYGKSKYLGEKHVENAGGKYYIIRPSRIFGKPGRAGSKKSFVEIMIEKADLQEIKVVSDERGSPTYAPHLAGFTWKLIKNNNPYGIYHGTNLGSCSWFEWAEEIFKLAGKSPKLTPISSKDYNNPAKRPKDSTLINIKAEPQPTWQNALKDYFSNL